MLWWCTANHMSNKSTFLLYASSSVGWEGWWPTNLCSNFYSPEPNRDATRTADDRVRASADNVPAWRLDSWAPPTYVWDHHRPIPIPHDYNLNIRFWRHLFLEHFVARGFIYDLICWSPLILLSSHVHHAKPRWITDTHLEHKLCWLCS